jgi:hypothetical protein
MFRCAGERDTICGDPDRESSAVAGGAGAAHRPPGGGCEVRVIDHQRGHYEVREVPYGKVYGWRPERLVFECDCGETHVTAGSAFACSCGMVYGDDQVDRLPDEAPLHPWLEDYEEWRRVREREDLRHEYFAFVEERDG